MRFFTRILFAAIHVGSFRAVVKVPLKKQSIPRRKKKGESSQKNPKFGKPVFIDFPLIFDDFSWIFEHGFDGFHYFFDNKSEKLIFKAF